MDQPARCNGQHNIEEVSAANDVERLNRAGNYLVVKLNQSKKEAKIMNTWKRPIAARLFASAVLTLLVTVSTDARAQPPAK